MLPVDFFGSNWEGLTAKLCHSEMLSVLAVQRAMLNLYNPSKICFRIGRPMANASCLLITRSGKRVSGDDHGIVGERGMAGQMV